MKRKAIIITGFMAMLATGTFHAQNENIDNIIRTLYNSLDSLGLEKQFYSILNPILENGELAFKTSTDHIYDLKINEATFIGELDSFEVFIRVSENIILARKFVEKIGRGQFLKVLNYHDSWYSFLSKFEPLAYNSEVLEEFKKKKLTYYFPIWKENGISGVSLNIICFDYEKSKTYSYHVYPKRNNSKNKICKKYSYREISFLNKRSVFDRKMKGNHEFDVLFPRSFMDNLTFRNEVLINLN
jgi:hypothetical protein